MQQVRSLKKKKYIPRPVSWTWLRVFRHYTWWNFIARAHTERRGMVDEKVGWDKSQWSLVLYVRSFGGEVSFREDLPNNEIGSTQL